MVSRSCRRSADRRRHLLGPLWLRDGRTPRGPHPSNVLFYRQNVSNVGVAISIGPSGAFSDPSYVRRYDIGVSDSMSGVLAGADVFLVSVDSEPAQEGWPAGPRVVFQLILRDRSGSIFSSDTIPEDLDLNAFDERVVILGNGTLGTDAPQWRIDSLVTSLVRVPELAPLLMFSIAMVALQLIRSRLSRPPPNKPVQQTANAWVPPW